MTDTIPDKEKNMILSRAALAAIEAFKKDPNLSQDKLIGIVNEKCARWLGIYNRMNKPRELLNELKTMFSSPLPETTLSEIYKRAANFSKLNSLAEKYFKALQKKLEEDSKTIPAPDVIDEQEKLIAQLREPDERLLGTRNLNLQVGEYKEIIISNILRQLETTQSSDNNVLNETIINAVDQIRKKIKEEMNNLSKFDQKVKTELLRIIGDPDINKDFLHEINVKYLDVLLKTLKDMSVMSQAPNTDTEDFLARAEADINSFGAEIISLLDQYGEDSEPKPNEDPLDELLNSLSNEPVIQLNSDKEIDEALENLGNESPNNSSGNPQTEKDELLQELDSAMNDLKTRAEEKTQTEAKVIEYKKTIISAVLDNLKNLQSSDNKAINASIISTVNHFRAGLNNKQNLSEFDVSVRAALLKEIGDPEINKDFLLEINKRHLDVLLESLVNDLPKTADNANASLEKRDQLSEQSNQASKLDEEWEEANIAKFAENFNKKIKQDVLPGASEAMPARINPHPHEKHQKNEDYSKFLLDKSKNPPVPFTAEELAQRIFAGSAGDLSKIGEFFGETNPDQKSKIDPFAEAVLAEYAQLCIDQDEPLLSSLRKFISHFNLPGEAQKIDRISEAFAKQFFEKNKDKYKDSDQVFFLIFATIILNTSLHNSKVPEKDRLTKVGFKNLACSLLFQNEVTGLAKNDIPGKYVTLLEKNNKLQSDIESIFDGIKANALKINTASSSKKESLTDKSTSLKTESSFKDRAQTKTNMILTTILESGENHFTKKTKQYSELTKLMKKLTPNEKQEVFTGIATFMAEWNQKDGEKTNGQTVVKENNQKLIPFLTALKHDFPLKPQAPTEENKAEGFKALMSNWSKSENIVSSYLAGNRSKIPVFNILQSRDANRISEVRQEQLQLLRKASEEAMHAYEQALKPEHKNDTPGFNDPGFKKRAEQAAAKIMLGAIGTLQAELKNEPNYLGSRLDKMLIDMEKQVRATVQQPNIMDDAKKQGMADLAKAKGHKDDKKTKKKK